VAGFLPHVEIPFQHHYAPGLWSLPSFHLPRWLGLVMLRAFVGWSEYREGRLVAPDPLFGPHAAWFGLTATTGLG